MVEIAIAIEIDFDPDADLIGLQNVLETFSQRTHPGLRPPLRRRGFRGRKTTDEDEYD
jgi:hypothetical protein